MPSLPQLSLPPLLHQQQQQQQQQQEEQQEQQRERVPIICAGLECASLGAGLAAAVAATPTAYHHL